MTNAEIVSLIASITSVIVGIFAIALAVVFFIMSSKISEGIKDSSNQINTNALSNVT